MTEYFVSDLSENTKSNEVSKKLYFKLKMINHCVYVLTQGWATLLALRATLETS